jgi:hypothetical protein
MLMLLDHGGTRQDAAHNVQDEIESLLAYCQDEGIALSVPAVLQTT